MQSDFIDFKIYDCAYDGSLYPLIYFYNNNDFDENKRDKIFYAIYTFL